MFFGVGDTNFFSKCVHRVVIKKCLGKGWVHFKDKTKILLSVIPFQHHLINIDALKNTFHR